jgi:hypothetical protein
MAPIEITHNAVISACEKPTSDCQNCRGEQHFRDEDGAEPDHTQCRHQCLRKIDQRRTELTVVNNIPKPKAVPNKITQNDVISACDRMTSDT